MQDQLVHILIQTEESYRGVHPTIEDRGPGWEQWFAQWMVMLSDISDIFGYFPSKENLAKFLAYCDREFQLQQQEKRWHHFMAKRMLEIIAQKA